MTRRVATESKTCLDCGQAKPLVEFHRRGNGRRSRCRSCRILIEGEKQRVKSAAWYARNKGKVSEAYHANPEPKKDYVRRNRERYRNNRLIREYGITTAEYQSILEFQGGGCAICGRKDSGGFGKYLHVDHCHEMGTVRGILCHHCNVAIGSLKHDPPLLTKAINYLSRCSAPPIVAVDA